MLDALRHFLLVVEHGTFTAAARHAHLSQPALTASIKKLEEQLGARILHRGAGGAEVTAAGQALLPSARAALTAVEEGRRVVAEVEGLRTGEVRVGAGATVCTYFLPPVLSAFRKKHPAIRLRLRESTTPLLEDAIAAGDLDLVITTIPAGQKTTGERLGRDELILVGAPGATADLPFVTFPSGATTRDLLERAFPSATVVMELSSIAAIKGHVRAGLGIALVSRVAVETDLGLGRLVELRHKRTPIARDMVLVHRGVERLAPAVAALRALLLGRWR
jgi:DNA-binding transcriptional LysR family regulator